VKRGSSSGGARRAAQHTVIQWYNATFVTRMLTTLRATRVTFRPDV